MKFKKGDRVLVVKDPGRTAAVGDTGTVIIVEKGDKYPYTVELDRHTAVFPGDDKTIAMDFAAKELEKI